MKQNFFIFLFFGFIFLSSSQTEYPQNYFQSPVDIKIAIAGTFGELRNNHFHSGIDIKTRQKMNVPIYSSQEGHLARIKISSKGLGKALYIEHPNGFTTVYAHLNNFNPEIEKLVKNQHYKLKKNEIDFSLENDTFKINKGELIAFSGNTGSSTGPHLHFEIRNTETQNIINPMLFNLPILDTSFPIIKSILIYHPNGAKQVVELEAINKNTYRNPSIIKINGPFQFAINTYDLLDAAPNKNGVYSIDLYINDSIYYQNTMETFGFYETRYINSHLDYATLQQSGEKFQKCFLDSYNKLSTNKIHTNQKIGESLESGQHIIKAIVKDSYNNQSILNFYFEYNEEKINNNKNQKNIIHANKVFEFDTLNCKIYLPNYSLYHDTHFSYKEIIDPKLDFPLFKILDDTIPSHKNFIISIKPKNLKKELRKKTIIAKYSDNNYSYIESKWSNDMITGKTNSFGIFTILIDTIKPLISYQNLSKSEISFVIEDKLSGIKDYHGKIDDKWVLMEYDYKTNLVKHIFDKPHNYDKKKFTIKVTDKVNNTNSMTIKLN
ncbi:MAG: hypothetical protein CMP65_04685 [Flavobacteriales bacterium]|nr:hypothetical protein [Flavobacteriales bacterium]